MRYSIAENIRIMRTYSEFLKMRRKYKEAIDASIEEVERHLEMGKQFLSKGQFADALTHYHAAVDLDPNNYMTLYRRATVYLATGKSNAAIPDLDRVLTLKPDFSAARLQRGNVLLKQGALESATVDFEAILAREPNSEEPKQKLSLIEPTRQNIAAANEHLERGDFATAEYFLNQALEVTPWDADLHEKRALCYEQTGQTQKAISDMRAAAKLTQDSTEAYFKLSMLYYRLADTEESLTQIRECLKLNPDHKKCFPHYKKLKKLVKQQENLREAVNNQNWPACLENIQKVLQTEGQIPALSHQMAIQECKCHSKAGNAEVAIQKCSELLHIEETPDILCDRADAYILAEKLEDALHDFQRAKEISEEFNRAHEGLQRVQKLIKQAKRKDYYKILGVRRNANKQQIMKAYRKLAQKWHPDNYQGDDKKAAEAKFIDIASAKEVLTNPEMRSKFDNGEDPLDPEQQAHGHGHPFQGFNPFGHGGPFTFKFNFN